MFLYEKIDAWREASIVKEVPDCVKTNLNPQFELRPYQEKAFENFIAHFEHESSGRQAVQEGVSSDKQDSNEPIEVLFHMATGSGKTLIMAGLMLYLYQKGYRNFLFFVNLSNIVQKTVENFCNKVSSKYLFAPEIAIDGERVEINMVYNFQYARPDAINICFATTQGLHTDMWMTKENGMSFDDFKGHKTVLISDEAHHLNVDTKKGKLTRDEDESKHSWEMTVRNILRQDSENVLLEFTATCDLNNDAIRAAYKSKIVFDYPLSKFYADKYSKEIATLRSECTRMERALMALVMSQYRLKVFQDNRLAIRPVVLFKAAKIDDSKEFMQKFIDAVKHLTGETLRSVCDANKEKIAQDAVQYFEAQDASLDGLAGELRADFSEEHCVSVNDEKDATEKQILLNSLEDASNPYRAIFEVKKLDEGWDVLNLFDIVRLYETRQSGRAKLSPATIAEAQLIGRGARYCPFAVRDNDGTELPKYQRKYDEDAANELHACETLCYHCQNDSRYVSELKRALREIGLDIDSKVQREYKLKDTFKAEEIYKSGLVFINERREKESCKTRRLTDSVNMEEYTFTASSHSSGTDVVLGNESSNTLDATHTARYSIKQMAAENYGIVCSALAKYPIYCFNTLKSYFPQLHSTREFITSDEYMGSVTVNIRSAEEVTPQTLYQAAKYAAGQVAQKIGAIKTEYEGTREFKPSKVKDVFHNKAVNYTKEQQGEGAGAAQSDKDRMSKDLYIDLSQEEWSAYEDNYGTTEEKAFIKYFEGEYRNLKDKYSRIYLLRNERELHIYSFDEGQRFEPDFVLFLQKDKDAGYEQLQIFIEPKGRQLFNADNEWKERFLLQLKDNAQAIKIYRDDNDYKIWGVHFFNREEKYAASFKEDMKSLYGECTSSIGRKSI